jgi:L-glyceraldehyde reductase
LKDLQTDYLDLYLVCFQHYKSNDNISHVVQIHWPTAFAYTNETLTPTDPVTKRFRLADVPVSDTWAALEKFVEAGKIRSIGISNFTIQATEDLLKTAKVVPAANQIEAHPYLLQPELFSYLKEKVFHILKEDVL